MAAELWPVIFDEAGCWKKNGFSVFGSRQSAMEYCHLNTGCWLLNFGCWMLDTDHWLLVTGYWSLIAGCWMLDARYWSLVTGHWLLDTR
jgi:hypothetical protein